MIRKYIELLKERDENTAEILEMLVDRVEYLEDRKVKDLEERIKRLEAEIEKKK